MGELLPFLGWLAVAVAAAVAGVVVVVVVRRWARREEQVETFTFQDLRNMRKRGQITQREFEKMRATLLTRMGLDAPSGRLASLSEPPDEAPPGDSAGAHE